MVQTLGPGGGNPSSGYLGGDDLRVDDPLGEGKQPTTGLPSGVFRIGSSGDSVERIQRYLKRAGFYGGALDGEFGVVTKRALEDFQRAAGIGVDGVYGNQTRTALLSGRVTAGEDGGGASTGGGSDGGSGIDFASTAGGLEDTAFTGLPQDGQVWRIGGKLSVVYQTAAGFPVYYHIPSQEVKDLHFPGGVEPSRTISLSQANKMGAITPGSVALLEGAVGSWEESFRAMVKRRRNLSPWMRDPEVVATIMAATLEGRTVTENDLENTDYFRKRSDAEIQHVAFTAKATPEELRQYNGQFYDTVRKALSESGVRAPSKTIIKYIANRWARGTWDDAMAARQIAAVANPYSRTKMEQGLGRIVRHSDVKSLESEARKVRDMVVEWLGPHHGNRFSDDWYRSWAGRILDDPAKQETLATNLRNQRLALYPQYEDPDLKYSDISPVWENMMEQRWGQAPATQRDWGVLDEVIRANNQQEAGTILKRRGLEYGVQNIIREGLETLGSSFGTQVVQ